MSIDFASRSFHPVVLLPEDYEVLDLSRGAEVSAIRRSSFTVGRYNEDRGIYTSELFEGRRTIHVGIDLGAPVGTPVHAFWAGTIFAQGYNAAEGDYGHTVVTHHRLDEVDLWALHGHLDARSTTARQPGEPFEAGDILGWLGAEHENGGWPPHVHFQLSYRQPDGHDLPGAVAPSDREEALRTFPDPRAVLGRIY